LPPQARLGVEQFGRRLHRRQGAQSSMTSTSRLGSVCVLLLLGLTGTISAVAVPVSSACPFGQTFEFDGCVPSPFLYTWDSTSPTATEAPHSCIWDMPWGRVSLPCNLMNCQTIIYPQGYSLHSQPVSCSSLTVSLMRDVNYVPVPIRNHDVLVTANLTCTGAVAELVPPAYINVNMIGKTNSNGTATFPIPSSLGNNGPQSSSVNCYTTDWFELPRGGGLTARDLDSGAVSIGVLWPGQLRNLTIWLPPISTIIHCGPGRGWYIL